jgi:hypothetical protein
MARAPAPLSALRAHIEDCTVLPIQMDDPVASGGVDATLTALGPPDLSQPARLARYGYDTTDHVYPRRGLALVVAVAYEHTSAPDAARDPMTAGRVTECSPAPGGSPDP